MKHLHRMEFPVRWGDMDVLGHVNNAHYLRYFEESRVEWATRAGWNLRPVGTGMILATASVTYKKPVVYPADVVVDLYAGKVGRTSFTLHNTLTITGDAEPATLAEFVLVWYDYVEKKPAMVPAELRELLQDSVNASEQ